MDRFDRIFKLHRILKSARYPVSRDKIMDELECSRATFTRILDYLRGEFNAPVVYDRSSGGYHYAGDGADTFELPGLWFNSGELYALVTCSQLLGSLQPGLLDDALSPFKERIEKIFQSQKLTTEEVARRIRFLRIGFHDPAQGVFQTVAEGTLRRKRLTMVYHGRTQDKDEERQVSPQRLSYYRDNWYLDAYCHLRNGLRLFALDRIKRIALTEKKAIAIAEKELEEYFATSYGIFAGKPRHTARLRFSPAVAQWVSREKWHPKQEGRTLEDGHYELRIPYLDSHELVRDILSHGPDVKVMEPQELRDEVLARIRQSACRYE